LPRIPAGQPWIEARRIFVRVPVRFRFLKEFLLLEPEKFQPDLRAAMREKKAAEFTLHCDMKLYRKLLIARLAQKKCRLPVGKRHQFHGLAPFYVLCLFGRKDQLINPRTCGVRR
jgi:hypothetical protein